MRAAAIAAPPALPDTVTGGPTATGAIGAEITAEARGRPPARQLRDHGWERQWLRRVEETVPIAALLLMLALPLVDIVGRRFGLAVPGSTSFLQHLTLWVAFLGAALASRERKLVALATGALLPPRWRDAAAGVAGAAGAAVAALLARGSLAMVMAERSAGSVVALGVHTWLLQLPLPIGFALVALRLVTHASRRWRVRAVAAAGLVAGVLVGQFPQLLAGRAVWPGILLLLLGTALGSPIFAVLGGVALLLFLSDGVPIAVVAADAYRLASWPLLAAVPLFTLTGCLLAEGRSSQRLMRLMRALCGWVPGGTAIVCGLVCAFFTIFTGGSGVTILALGGLMFPTLLAERYGERFSLGLLTASGSLGLLWPPALPLILYGIVADVAPQRLFLGGLLPGLVMAGLLAAWSVREGRRSALARQPFRWPEARQALWEAKWELALPLVVLGGLLGGLATLVETSALAALYALVVKTAVHRELASVRRLAGALRECVTLVGAILVILAAAMGFTGWLVDAEVPAHCLVWVQQHVHSQWLFLLGLNLFLLVAGSLMEIFAAIVVIVPLLVPIGAAFGVDPVHLGVLFIANLELGYLLPPAGLNLFLASTRLERSVLEVYRAVLPFLALQAVGVLLITYLPFLTTWLLPATGR